MIQKISCKADGVGKKWGKQKAPHPPNHFLMVRPPELFETQLATNSQP